MRNLIKIVLIIFISISSFGQDSKNNIKIEKEIFIELSNGEKDSSNFIKHYKEYDELGNITLSIDYCPGSFGCSESDFEFERKHEYKYDEHGNEILELFYSQGNSNPAVITETINIYDSHGLLIQKTFSKKHISKTDTSDWGKHVNTFEYDGNKNLTKKTDEVLDEFNSRKWETLYKYDSENNLIELIQPSDIWEIREKYTYDRKGNCTNYLMIGGPTTIHNTEKWEQKFDSKGNLIERKETTYIGKERIIKYSYDENNLTKRVSFESDGLVQKSIERKYNEFGDLIEIKKLNSQEQTEEISRFIYEYY
ncbi:MAG: hypothetical protein JEY97_15140 [Bacteroidales bacterium]|nr:hypothetical protein [Bacteroidales bacterium]